MKGTLLAAAGLTLLLGVGGCTGDDDKDDDPGSSSSSGKDGEITTNTTVLKVSGHLDQDHRLELKAATDAAIDPFFDGAYLGDFPRTDYADAFAGFTAGAQDDARRDLELLSNEPISDEIDSATAVNRRVRLDVFAPQGHPRGVTAHFVLDFTTTGDLEGTRRVHGELYLSKEKGVWKIFGYDVDEASEL